MERGRGDRVRGRGDRVRGRGDRVRGRGDRVRGRGDRVKRCCTGIGGRGCVHKLKVATSKNILFT